MKLASTTKITVTLLSVYAFGLTLAIAIAVSVGPLRNSFNLWARTRVLEAQLKERSESLEKLTIEKDRLVEAVKKIQTEWTSGQETITALRKLVDNPESEQKILEATQLAEKLSQERAVLITKLNELREKLEACSDRTSATKDQSP